MSEYLNNWRNNNPKRYKKHKETQRIREKADLIKSNCWKNDYKKKDEKCKFCDSEEKLEFHHTDYSKHAGFTLCMSCHRQLHDKHSRGE